MQNILPFSDRINALRASLSFGLVIAAALIFFLPAMAGDGGATAEVPAHLGTVDAAKGEKLFKRRCRACHTNVKDGPNKTGPNLWEIVGREQGGKEGVRYSEGMKAKGGHWGFAELDRFLTRPADYIDDTRMAFPGLRKASDRADLIAYLRSLSDDPLPFSLN